MSRLFGQIAQIGYVVRDIRASMDNWVQHASARGSTSSACSWTTSATAALTRIWK
jgi:hypothetical protein